MSRRCSHRGCRTSNSGPPSTPMRIDPREGSVAGELLSRELPETIARVLVRAERLVVGVLRIGRDLFRDRSHLAVQRGVMFRVAQQGLHPVLVGVLGGELLLEQ